MVCSIRLATINDACFIYKVRNQKKMVELSTNKKYVSFEEHRLWLLDRIAQEDAAIFIIQSEVDVLGVLRLELMGSASEISIYLAPEFWGLGFGTKALTDAIILNPLNTGAFQAVVRVDNRASCKMFLKLGFKKNRKDINFYHFKLNTSSGD